MKFTAAVLLSIASAVMASPVPQTETSKEVKSEPRCLQPNALWLECGTACPPTCANPKPEVCILPCIVGCQCAEGFLLNDDGLCVTSDKC